MLPRRTCQQDLDRIHETGDRIVGEAIEAWEHVRPTQPKVLDEKTGEFVDYLFINRAKRIGPSYLNRILIPTLCRKAGIPTTDCRGSITSHRARSTIATQLYNAKEPMSLFELQQWLDHRSLKSTQYYASITPTKLAKAYSDAGYFGRNLRAVELLIDRDVVMKGTAAQEPWKFYDLGHGYCSYDFFDQCPHRMACAKCGFYLAKGDGAAEAAGESHRCADAGRSYSATTAKLRARPDRRPWA